MVPPEYDPTVFDCNKEPNVTDIDELQSNLLHDLDAICNVREELRLKLSLAKADARSEWDRLEMRMERAQEEIGRVGLHATEAMEQIESGVRKLIEEIKAGYERFRQQSP